jgi:hypothetical protein
MVRKLHKLLAFIRVKLLLRLQCKQLSAMQNGSISRIHVLLAIDRNDFVYEGRLTEHDGVVSSVVAHSESYNQFWLPQCSDLPSCLELRSEVLDFIFGGGYCCHIINVQHQQIRLRIAHAHKHLQALIIAKSSPTRARIICSYEFLLFHNWLQFTPKIAIPRANCNCVTDCIHLPSLIILWQLIRKLIKQILFLFLSFFLFCFLLIKLSSYHLFIY